MIIIDNREKFKKDIKKNILEINPKINIEYGTLKLGDYEIRTKYAKVLVERKAISDIAIPKNAGVFLERNDRVLLEAKYKQYIVIIENDNTHIKRDGRFFVKRSGVNKYFPGIFINTLWDMISREEERGIIFINTDGLKETAAYLAYLHEKSSKRQVYKGLRLDIVVDDLILSLPGVGIKKLEKLSEKFGSNEEILKNCDKWMNEKQRKYINESR